MEILAKLIDQLEKLEARVAKLERTTPGDCPIPSAPLPQVGTPRSQESIPSVAATKKIADVPVRRSEEIRSGNWLGAIAVICFILAAGFIVKLAIDSGWLTPARQLALAFVFGGSLIGAGFWLEDRDQEYASLLPAAGISILFLTVFAAHRFHNLISFQLAIVATSFVSALCVYLYDRIRHDVYAIAAACGAYLSPVILGLNVESEFSLYYLIFCSIAFSLISAFVASRTLTVCSSYLAIGMTAVVGGSLGQPAFIASLLGVHFIVFVFGTFQYTKMNQALTRREAWLFFPVLIFFYASEYRFLSLVDPSLASWISLAFAGLLLALYLSAKRLTGAALESRDMILSFASVVFFHSFYLEILPSDAKPILLIAILAFGIFVPFELGKRSFGFPVLALGAVMVLEYLHVLLAVFGNEGPQWYVYSAIISATSITLFLRRRLLFTDEIAGYFILSAAHALAVAALKQIAEPGGSFLVSAAWLVYALFIVAIAYPRRDKVMAKSALLVLNLAAAKALLFDTAATPSVVRIFCLLLTGAVLYGCGLFLRQMSDWTDINKRN